MNILLTNIQLTIPGGTVSYILDLAKGLRQRGATVEIYTYKIGQTGRELQQEGFNVVMQLNQLINEPDIIHAHHNPTAIDVLRKFKNTPVIYFLHDKTSPFDYPVKHSNIIKHVAVDYNCLDRLLHEGKIDEKFTTVIYNWVDTNRFKLRTQFNEKPLTALVFSNYATNNNYYKIIERACKEVGLQITAIGSGIGKSVAKPEDLLGNYDIVFAKAKAAMEALATGAAVITCDFAGLGQMVTPSNFAYLRKYNFGRKILTRKIAAHTIIEEIKKYNIEQNKTNANAIRMEAGLDKTLDILMLLYEEVITIYKLNKRGPSANWIGQITRSFFYKKYFYFTCTGLFKVLSKLKYRVKEKLIQ